MCSNEDTEWLACCGALERPGGFAPPGPPVVGGIEMSFTARTDALTTFGNQSSIPQQFVDAGFAAGFFVHLFDDHSAIQAVAAVFAGQVAGDND